MTSSGRSRRRFGRAVLNEDPDRFAMPGLVVAIVAAALLTYHLTRGSSFLSDDWIWIDSRRGNDLNTFLAPYNGHLSLVPIAVYRLMFATVGIGDFAAYRVLLIVVASATGIVFFTYLRGRVGPYLALLLTAVLLVLGPGWNDLLQPFQIAWLIAVATAVLALSLLERRRRTSDAAACALIIVSLSSTSVGVALAVGIAVELALTRRRWRDAWIVALPLLLYAAWSAHYHPSQIQLSAATGAPLNLAQTSASGLSGLAGLSNVTPVDLVGQSLVYGIPLLVLGMAAVPIRRAAGWEWSRFAALAAMLVTFSLMTTLARSFQSPFESRYMYVICVLLALMVAELGRGLTRGRWINRGLAAVTVFAVVSNVGVLRSGAAYFRQLGAVTDATLTAVDLDRALVTSSTPLSRLPLYPLATVTAGQYLSAERALGTPADSVAQLHAANAQAQAAADGQALADGAVTFARGTAGAPASGAGAPVVVSAANGSAATAGACVRFEPASALAPGASNMLTLRLPPGRVAIRAGFAAVTVSARRFAPVFSTLGMLGTRGTAIVTVARDGTPDPWELAVDSASALRVCAVSAG